MSSQRISLRSVDMVDVTDYGALGNGTTDDSAAVQAAVTAGISLNLPVYFPAGNFRLASEVTLGGSVQIVGAGRDYTIISEGPTNGYLLHKSSTTPAHIEISDITFDTEDQADVSAVRAQYVTGFRMRQCRVRNVAQWGVVVGVLTGSDTVIRNTDVLFDDVEFDGITGTWEQLLLFNSRDVVVRNCRFLDTAASSISLGLYQNLHNVLIDGCVFQGSGFGAYYSLSTDDITFNNCHFEGLHGIRGAHESDNGDFGETYVRNLVVQGSRFSVSGAVGLQLGAVRGGVVTGNVFHECEEVGIYIDSGENPVSTQSTGLTITGNIFRDNNQSNTNSQLHPCIFLETNGFTSPMGIIIMSNDFVDDQGSPTQYYPITIYGTGAGPAVAGLLIAGNRMDSDGGFAIRLEEGATQGTDFKVWGNIEFDASPGITVGL